METSEGDDTSFIVLGSQTQESELVNPTELYQQLHALSNNNDNNDKMVNAGHGSRLRRNRNGQSYRTAAGDDQTSNNQNNGGGTSSVVTSGGGGGVGMSQGGVPQPGEGGMSSGAGGGDGPGGNDPDGPGELPDFNEDSEEENAEETTSSDNSVPTLMKVGEVSSSRTPRQDGQQSSIYPTIDLNQYQSSESETGMSDAPTAVVSDSTDGEGVNGPKGSIGRNAKLLSSETSSMSNTASSSEGDLNTTVKLRSSSARMKQQPRRLQILSTQEMAERENNEAEEFAEDDAEDRFVLTPAEHLGTLHFSGQTSYVMESVDDSDVVPPSQDYEIPMMVPTSPTATEGPSVSYRSPRSRRHLKFPTMSPRRQKQLIGGASIRQHGNGNQGKSDGNPNETNPKNDSSSNSAGTGATQPQQWAPSASLSITGSIGQQGESSESNDGDRIVAPSSTIPADKEEEGKAEEEEKADEEKTDEETPVTQASIALVCPIHGVKEESVDSQNLVLQLSQSQSWLPSSTVSGAPQKTLASDTQNPDEPTEKEPEAQPEPVASTSACPVTPSQESRPQTSSIDEATYERETESPSQPRFTFDRPTLEEVPEGSEKNYSVFKKAVRQRREAEAKKLAPDSSSGDDPFGFESQPGVSEPSRPRKRKLDNEEEKPSKRLHAESPEEKEKSEKIDLGPPTLIDDHDQSVTQEYEYTGLRQAEADSVNRSKTPGEASTPQEAMRSLVMDTGSSGETPKEPEVKSAEEKPRYFSNSAPEAGGRMRSTNPIRPTFPHSAGEGSGGITRLNTMRAIREKTRRRYQDLQASSTQTLVQSPQMERYLASQTEQHHPQGEEVRQITVKHTVNYFTTYKVFSSGKMDIMNMNSEVVGTSFISDEAETSPVSSKSSHPSIASGELADISSLSRSSGDHSSGSFTKPSIPTVKKKSPSSSSSYDPTRQSIDDYMNMKRLSTFSTVSTINQTGDDVPLHRRRTVSEEENVPAAVPSTSAQADHSSVAQSEALFSTPPSNKTDSSVNKTTSTSGSSFQCAQPPPKSRTSDSSVATATSTQSLVLSPNRVSFSPSDADAVAVTHKDRQTKQESFESSRSRSSSGGKSIPLFSDTYSSHHSSETSRRSDDGIFRVPSVPIQSDKGKKSPSETKTVGQPEAKVEGDDTIMEEEEEESLTPQAGAVTPRPTEGTAHPTGVQEDVAKADDPEETEEYVHAQSAQTKGRSVRAVTQGSASKGRAKKLREDKPSSTATSEPPQAAESAPAKPKKSGEESKGYPVYAQWQDKYFYPGHIVGEERGGRYKVHFEDGNYLQVKETDIILVELLPVGQDVFAEKNETYESAEVLDHVDVEGANGYLVKFTDDSETRLERSLVIMSPDQAREFVRLSHAKPGTPQQDVADVSLDNLVMGKRKRGSGSIGTPVRASTSKDTGSRATRGSTPGRSAKSASESSSSATSSSTKKGSAAKKGKGRGRPRGKSPARKIIAKDEAMEQEFKLEDTEDKLPELSHISDISSEDCGQPRKRTKRKLVVEPKATSTPTPQKRRARITSHEELAEPLSPLEVTGTTPPGGADRSPRKSRMRFSGDAVKGPIPPIESQLFVNMKFLLTSVEKMDDRRPAKGRPSDSNTDESIQDEGNEIMFDKNYLTAQIEGGGGTIMDKFDIDNVNENCYCLSDSYQRTLKYLNCLAANIPCVSHVWVHNCCSANRILDFKAYVLPAGFSIQRRVVVEQNVRKKPFARKTVLISSTNEKFQTMWTDVLISANCKVLHTPPSRAVAKDLLVAVVDSDTAPSLIAKLNSFGVSIVSSEWVIQCLISGGIVSTEGHPRYMFDYEPPEKSL